MDSSTELFLSDVQLRNYELPTSDNLTPIGLALGQGSQAVEVAVAEANDRPTATSLRRVWKKRHGGRAAPLLLVALYDGSVSVCGPAGDQPSVYRELEIDQVERICRSVLDAPDRHAAINFLRDVLPEAETAVPGVKNTGLLATHELQHGVPRRPDWREANEKARPLLSEGGREVLEGLGYEIESLHGPASILTTEGGQHAVAVFLDQDEAIEVSSERFTGLSPVSYALAQAEQQRLPWVIVAKGRMLRLYSADSGTGVASRGRTDTYVQARTDLLRDEQAGYLSLLFSPDALAQGGTLEEILESSEDYAADLRGRLRERIYDEVVPDLAEGIARARELEDPTQEELEETYQITLLLLYRLLFVAYAEDRRLLPYETNESYRNRSLKQKAHELNRIVDEDADFDDSSTHWREMTDLFSAVREGSTEWEVPQYDGTLFSDDPDLSPEGAALREIELTNKEFGPPLSKLLLDKGPEGLGPIDFRSLGVREFGTIYEGLLESELSVADRPLTVDEDGEYVPAEEDEYVEVEQGSVYLHDTSGKRKRTGSYYTKTFAVEHLLEHSLDPALDRHLEELDDLDDADASERFFDFRVADIAMGSGHFLLAAVDHIEERFAEYLARRQLPGVRAELERLRKRIGEELGDPALAREVEDGQLLRRQIARRCIYGVDINPVAVHLARLAVWIHTFVPGLPLSFLDHGLVEGNSLLGIATLEEGKEAADRVGEVQGSLFTEPIRDLLEQGQDAIQRLGQLSDANASEIRRARKAQQEAEEREAPLKALFDILTAARVNQELQEQIETGSVLDWEELETLPDSEHHRRALEVLKPLEPFHFPVRFPEVFRPERSGFDVIVGNPPWDKVLHEPQQFWVTREPGLNRLSASERTEAIKQLRQERPTDASREEKEKERRQKLQDYFKVAFEQQGRGHKDYSKLFTERAVSLLSTSGRLGFVLPRQSLVLGGWKQLRRLLFEESSLLVAQARNSGGWLFEDVEHRYMVTLMVRAPADAEPSLYLWPAVKSREAVKAMGRDDALEVPRTELEELSPSFVIPWFESRAAAAVFDAMREHPGLSEPEGWIQGEYDSRWDFSTTGSESNLVADDPGDGAWRVLMARHVEQFGINHSHPYRRKVEDLRALAGLEKGVVRRDGGFMLEEDHPSLAYRYPSRNDDSRTLIVTALPDAGILYSTGYVHGIWTDPSTASVVDVLALLAFLNSFTCDWWARRFVDRHVNKPVIQSLRLPDWGKSERKDAAQGAATMLLSSDIDRLPGGREIDSLARNGEPPSDELRCELEVLAARGFDLTADEMEVVFHNFSSGACPDAFRSMVIDKLP